MKWDRTKGRPEPIRALNLIREIDNGEPLVDLREAAPTTVLIREATIPYCRLSVARMVEQAAQALPQGIKLAVTDAWRPFERQQRIYEWIVRHIQDAFPGISYASMRRKACRWVAPVDQKAPPGHCTGAALDIALIGPDGEPLDVTSPFNRFAASPTYVFGLSPSSQANRDLMVGVMLDAGFSNCRDEYWHYSWGDAGWAVRAGKDECCYGLIELDESLWREKQDLWWEQLRTRPNPFLEARLQEESESNQGEAASRPAETAPAKS